MPEPKQVTKEEEEDYIDLLEEEVMKGESPISDIDIKHIKIMKILMGEKAKLLVDLEALEKDINEECDNNIFIQRLPITTKIGELLRIFKYLQLRQFSIDNQNQSYQTELRNFIIGQDRTEEIESLKQELNNLRKEKSEEEKLSEKIKNAIDEFNIKQKQFKNGKIEKYEVNLARGNIYMVGKDNPALTKELMEKYAEKGD